MTLAAGTSPGAAPGADPDPGSASPPAARRPRRRWLGRVLVVLVLLLVLPGISFTRAMTYPGSAPASVRAVEWVRDHGGGGIVNLVENWVYSHNAPPAQGTPSDQTTADPAATPPPATTAGTPLPAVPLLPGVKAVQGEGVWHATGQTADHQPALYTTWFRPDRRHTPVAAGAALIPRDADVLHLAGGTREPVAGLHWASGSAVPRSDLSTLVAAFNGGFKSQDSHGGWYGDGRTALRLRTGAASLVIYRDGHAQVGAWNQGVNMTPDVVAVRQNLALVVDHGAPVPGLSQNARGRWGTAHIQFQYTWRSGAGLDANGDLIYVAGQGLTLAMLATAMQKAGIQTGMELDIHPAMVSFNIFTPGAHGRSPSGRKLLRSMTRSAGRYLTADQRDFFYVTAR